MSTHLPLFGMLTYQRRHVRMWLRWPALVLPLTAAAIPVADTPTGMVIVGVAAAITAVIVALRCRWLRAAAKIEEIVATKLIVGSRPHATGRPHE